MGSAAAGRARGSGAHAVPPPSSEGTRLCRVCAKIDFDRFLGEKIAQRINLGSWYSICQVLKCPFCRLVTRCLESNPYLTPRLPHTNVYLENELSWKLGIELSPYDQTKSESYSNKYDLRSMAGRCFLDAYRFTVTVEDPQRKPPPGIPKKQGIIQYLGYKEKTRRDQQFFGRWVRPAKVDITLLQWWLQICSSCHGAECCRDDFTDVASESSYLSSSDDELPSNLRLIDVVQGHIVKARDLEAPEYVALSYVWGKEEMRKETGMLPVVLKRTMIVNNGERECTPLPRRLPKTIQDAMKLTNHLGYRYLWCDALCIVQDDTLEDKIPHLTNMKAIYSHSSLTVAAAAGSHVDHGLPGISVPRKVQQYSELVGTLRLATMFPSFSDLENSSELLWNTRGWTFQEKLLSKRILLFTDYQVYYKCSESIWTEEIMLETEHVSKSVEARPGKYRWQPSRGRDQMNTRASLLKHYNPQLQVEDEWDYLGGFLDYSAAIQEYTRRTLSDDNDTLWAINGVLETMEEVTGKFFLGLPRKHFLESLLWYPEVGSLHHFNDSRGLPSWTWASSTFERKGISFDMMDVRQLRAVIELTKRAFPSKSEDEESSNSSDDKPSYVGLIGMYANLLACMSWPLIQKHLTIRRLYYCYGSEMKRIRFNLPVSAFNVPGLKKAAENYARSGYEDWRPNRELIPPDQHVLAFETVVVKFRIGSALSERLSGRQSEVGVFELLNSDNKCVGEVITTYGRARRRRGSNEFLTISWSLSLAHAEIDDAYIPRWRFNSKADKKSFRSLFNDDEDTCLAHLMGTEIGFAPIFLGSLVQKYSRYMPKETVLKFESSSKPTVSASELCTQVYYAQKGQPRPRSLWTVVNLMLVDFDGHVARRAGVGKVILGAWREEWNIPEEVILA